MNSGRELDAWIAEKVMGVNLSLPENSMWRPLSKPVSWSDCPKDVLPPYSTDIAAAWQVVEKMIERKNTFEIFIDEGCNGEFIIKCNRHTVTSKSAPHAICLAALKACGVEV